MLGFKLRMRSFAPALLILAAFGCSSSSMPPNEQAPVDPATYQRDIRAVLEANCTVCHVAGGIGPYPLDSYEAAKQYGPLALAAVESGKMPPWMPNGECRHYENERVLSADQKAQLHSWVAGGMIEGDPADYRPLTKTTGASLSEMGPPSAVLAPSTAYTPKTERPDDYHCFPLDYEFNEETYLVMTNVHPEHPELVHHVIIYLVPPQYLPQLATLDAQEAGEGYTCFGGPGTGQPQNIGAWVPGSVPAKIDGDAAIRIPKGSKLVMQMHYNTLAAGSAPDKTELEMWFRDTQPAYILNVVGFPHLGIDLPAGEANVHETRTFTNTTDRPWVAGAVAPHMHLLGTRIAMTAVHANGEECIIDIPRWDFNWQQSYRFQGGGVVTIAPSESVRLDCWYDNSASHQPIVNGVQLEPREVNWGEGTLDEMCLGFLATVEPYAPLPAPSDECPSFQNCYDGCIQSITMPRTGCALQCANQSGPACGACVGMGIGVCVLDDCPKVVGDMVECADGCNSAASPDQCVRTQCLGNILDFDQCAAPKIESNACDVFVSGCGVDL